MATKRWISVPFCTGTACAVLAVGCGAPASDDELATGSDERVGSIQQAATVLPVLRQMPASPSAAEDERPQRAARLVDWWYRDFVRAGRSFGDPNSEGGQRSFRRVAAVLEREGPAAAAAVEQWTTTIAPSHHAGTACTGDDGDWDMTMKEMVRLLYLYKDRGDLLTDNAAFNIVSKGLASYLGATANKMVFSCFGTSYPETENHVLMIESTRYLTNQWIYENRRGEPRYYELYPNIAGQNVNAGSQVEDVLLQAMGRVVWGDFFEFNSRSYQGLAAMAILNLYDFASSEPVRAAAKNALDFATTKFAFGSYEGKRWAPTRRNHHYANSLNMQEHDSFVLLMSALSGGYVWDDIPGSSTNFYDQTWSGVPGSNLYQGVGLALWAAGSQYKMPEASHDFLLNKHDGYWARMHARHYLQEYEASHWPHYFTSPTARSINGGLVFSPEYYFVTPRFMNTAGGNIAGYPLRSVFAVENEVDNYDILSRPMALLTPGHYGAWPDDVSFGRCGGIPGTSGIDRNIGNVTSTLLTMMGDAKFWKSHNDGVYKSLSYGYYYNTTCGANDSAHTQWPMEVPSSWAVNLYKEGTTSVWSKGRGNFRFYDLRAELGFYVVLGHVSKSMNMDKYRKFSRGFWEVVPAERFANAAALKNWVLSDANNPTSSYSDTTSGDAKWFKYKMTTGETVWLDILVGFDDGLHNDPIIRVVDPDGSVPSLDSRIYSRNSNANPPLIEVYGVDAQYRTGHRYANSSADGYVQVNNPFVLADLTIDSRNYTAPTRIEQGGSLSDALEQPYLPNQFWISSHGASGFSRKVLLVDGAYRDVLLSDPVSDNQIATAEIGQIHAGVRFDWSVSSEGYWDRLDLVVDGVVTRSISGEQTELGVTVPLPRGFHKVHFRYSKDSTLSRGQDQGWVDALTFL
jgi:hypothetical protein